MTMDNTLINRCQLAYAEGAINSASGANRQGIRAVIEHLAAELVVLNQYEAARCLLSQLSAEVIPLRPTTKEPA
jgi:hypothetical protein